MEHANQVSITRLGEKENYKEILEADKSSHQWLILKKIYHRRIRNLLQTKKSHQKYKHMESLLRKIFYTIFEIDKGAQIYGLKDKEIVDDVPVLTAEGRHRQTICIKKRRRKRIRQHWQLRGSNNSATRRLSKKVLKKHWLEWQVRAILKD